MQDLHKSTSWVILTPERSNPAFCDVKWTSRFHVVMKGVAHCGYIHNDSWINGLSHNCVTIGLWIVTFQALYCFFIRPWCRLTPIIANHCATEDQQNSGWNIMFHDPNVTQLWHKRLTQLQNSMLSCISSVIDHRWHQNAEKTKKWHTSH